MSSPGVTSSPTGGPSSPPAWASSLSSPPGGPSSPPPGSPPPYTPTSPGYLQQPSASHSQHSGQQFQQGAVVVQTSAPMIVVGGTGSMGFGPVPAQMTCPFCRRGMVTQVESQPSAQAWIAFAVLCFLGCWLGCCCIPLCLDSCQRTTHTCSNCHRVVGYGGGEAF